MYKILDLFFRQNTGILMWLEMFWLMHSHPTLFAHCGLAASTRSQTNTLGVTSLGTRPILGTVSRPGHGLMGWAQAWFQWPLLSSSLRPWGLSRMKRWEHRRYEKFNEAALIFMEVVPSIQTFNILYLMTSCRKQTDSARMRNLSRKYKYIYFNDSKSFVDNTRIIFQYLLCKKLNWTYNFWTKK